MAVSQPPWSKNSTRVLAQLTATTSPVLSIFLAMSRKQLGHTFRAHRHLAEAIDTSNELGNSRKWEDEVVLRRQAETLIDD